MKKFYLFILLAAIAGIFAFFIILQNSSKENNNYGKAIADFKEITVYKTQYCGCCENYIIYLSSKGFKASGKEVSDSDLIEIRKEYNIPYQLQSCHTSIIGPYFIEGHVPIEAINKLLTEKSNIAGISLPGMPPGSPGMPGFKSGPFIIYAVKKDGTRHEFMRE